MNSYTKNFKLVIQYLGTPYNGWQYQPNCPTIQGEIEVALKKIFHKSEIESKCPKIKNKREKSTPRRPRPGHTICLFFT